MLSLPRMAGGVFLAFVLLLFAPSSASASIGSDVGVLVNGARAQAGLTTLSGNSSMDQVAQAWAERLAAAGSLSHNPSYSQQIPGGWQAAAENVAYASAPSASGMHQQLMNSSGHRANILGNFSHLGVGYAVDGRGGGWLVEVFGKYPAGLGGDYVVQTSAPPAAPPPAPADPQAGTGTADQPPSPTGTAPPPDDVMRPGESGEDVAALQQDLTTLGYPVEPGGYYDEATTERVRQFQSDAGLEVDGVTGQTTRGAISTALLSVRQPSLPTQTISADDGPRAAIPAAVPEQGVSPLLPAGIAGVLVLSTASVLLWIKSRPRRSTEQAPSA